MAKRKTVWMVSGNKGGVGKSLFCLALASSLEMRGETFAVFDGDGRTGDVYAAFLRKVPALWGDFRELRPDSHNCPRDAEYERTLHQLLAGSEHVIVNTPDGADSMLAKWFDVTLQHTESADCLFKFIYLMSDRPDGLDMIPLLTERFQFLYPVQNRHFGEQEVFSAFNREHAKRFHMVLEFPVLRGEEVRALFNIPTYPTEAIALKSPISHRHTISVLSRKRLIDWQASVNDAICDVIDNDDVSNLVLSEND